MSRTEGQIKQGVEGEALARIEGGVGIFRLDRDQVRLPKSCVGVREHQRGRIVQGVRPGVGGQQALSVGVALLQLGLHPVVVAVANMVGKIRAAEVRQRTGVLRAVAGVLQRQGAVRIGQRPQVVRCVAHIADGGNDALGNAALDGEVVVLRVGRG